MVADILDVFPKDQMVTSQDGKAYDEAVRRWADNAQRQAKVVVLPRTSEDVSKAIRYAVANDLEIAIRGGGHSCSGASSSDGLVIDLRHFASVSVDQDKRLLIVGGGAIWETVDREAAKYGLATVGGTVNHTGVGGLTLGGGYGWLTGDYGLALDNVVQAEVVIANGDILTCNAMENTDLFWAIRGGGSNFGVITAFVFQAHPQPNLIWSGLTVFAPDNLPAIVQASQKISKLPPKGRTSCIIFSCPRPALEPAIVFLPFYNGPEEVGRAMFKPILDIGPLTDMTRQMPYEQQNALFNDVTPVGGRKLMKSAYIGAEIDEGVIMNLFRAFVKLLEQYRELKPSIIVVDLHPFQKIMEVPPDGTAFANRGPLYNLSMLLWWTNPELDGMLRTSARPSRSALTLCDLTRRCTSGRPTARRRYVRRKVRAPVQTLVVTRTSPRATSPRASTSSRRTTTGSQRSRRSTIRRWFSASGSLSRQRDTRMAFRREERPAKVAV